MTDPQPSPQPTSPDSERMAAVLRAQRADLLAEGFPPVGQRIDRMRRGMESLARYKEPLVKAMDADFGCRPRELSMLVDVAAGIQSFKGAIQRVARWMKPERRRSNFPMNLLGGRSRVEYQPLGVVGVISPWNFPLNLTFGPLAGILASGNRAMIKPSEFTPRTSGVMAELVADAWDEKEVALFTGDAGVGAEFSRLPFDHLLFTGAASVARHILAAAAPNLVPVTLELGGKSPVLVSRSADIRKAAGRIMLGKVLNAGQICLAPDYLLVPAEKLDEIVGELGDAVASMFPTLLANPHYTSVINDRHHDRLQELLADARARGAEVLECNPAREDFSARNGSRKLPPTILWNTTEEMRVMQEEIFGPLLPIKTYRDLDEAIGYINRKPRPLALYYFGEDASEERAVLDRTTSGGVCLNDVIMQFVQEDLPFGGVGPAGMGAYHGFDGFRNFSHARAVYRQSKLDIAGLGGMRPPYGKNTEKAIRAQTRV